MKRTIGIAVTILSVLLFGSIATSSIAEGKKSISKRAKEQAIAHQEKGSKFDDDGDLENAITEYRKSLEYDPEDPNTLFNLGVVYLKVNKAAESEKIFERLSKLLPNDNEVFNLLGVAYSGNGKKDDAIKAWEKSLTILPEQPKVKDMIEELRMAANTEAKK